MCLSVLQYIFYEYYFTDERIFVLKITRAQLYKTCKLKFQIMQLLNW